MKSPQIVLAKTAETIRSFLSERACLTKRAYFVRITLYMPKKIDHEERKEKILKTALEVFSEVGYRDANLSLIAERCSLSRPTIYQYFKDKDEIYYYAVKLVTGHLFLELSEMAFDLSLGDEIDRLIKIAVLIVDYAISAESELTKLMEVMLQQKEFNKDFSQIIYKRTAKLSILFRRLLSHAKHENVVKPDLDVDMSANHLFSLLESFCFQIAFFKNFNRDETVSLLSSYLNSLR